MPDTPPFWKQKSLAEMTPEEWEALCDGCGWCCLYKLEDEETNEIVYTRVACRLLNLKTCRCMDYADRARAVPTCVQITCENILELTWLPETCAYRRLALGKDLPGWHYLLSGSKVSVHKARASVLGIAISEYGVDLDDLDAYILAPDEDAQSAGDGG
jgi:uncharacterized cysteine cluster protein YcgN (CxxCxxCC family)